MINFLFIPIRLFHRKKSIFSTIHGSIRIGSLFSRLSNEHGYKASTCAIAIYVTTKRITRIFSPLLNTRIDCTVHIHYTTFDGRLSLILLKRFKPIVFQTNILLPSRHIFCPHMNERNINFPKRGKNP